MVAEYLEENLYSPGITLVDGYPKELELVTLIDQQKRQGDINVMGTIDIATSDHLAVTRQLGRNGVNSTHPTYGEAVAQERVELHNSYASPVAEHLARLGTYLTIDGNQSLTAVQEDFIASLQALCTEMVDEVGA